jgi:hypothetical protein
VAPSLEMPTMKSDSTTTDYLVEMKIAPTGTVLTPQEGAAFAERFLLPTLDACERLRAEGRIVAGGPVLGAMAFTFVVRGESVRQVDELVSGLPFWPRAQTTVVPLGSFELRAAAVRQRLAASRAGATGGSPASATRN